MKKVLKIVGRVVLGIIILLVSFLFIIKIQNHIAMSKEKELLENHPGVSVEVDGHNMNLHIEGEGERTIVFLSGWKTPSPIYDFKPLYSKLSDEYRCVVIERFGYGFSDEIEGERDFDTILRQDREALKKAGIEGPYVLCAHSLSGLEVTLWAQKYPDEVEAIIGLDMTLSEAINLEEAEKSFAISNITGKVGRFWGINRLLMNIAEFDGLTDEEIEMYIAVGCKNLGNDTACNESEGIAKVVQQIETAQLPSVPTIQYVSGVNRSNELWVNAHRKYVEASSKGQYIQLDHGHAVYQYEPKRIATDIKKFMEEID